MALGFVVFMSGGQAYADPTILFDRWYRVLLEGQHVGWSRTTVSETDADGLVTTTIEMQMTMRRGPAVMSMTTHSSFLETSDGQPIEARGRQVFGQMQVSQTMRFGPDGVELTTRQGTLEQQKKLPLPRVPAQVGSGKQPNGGWLTPGAAARFIEQQLAQGAKQINYWSLDPLLGTDPIEVRMTIQGNEDIEAVGKVVQAVVCDISTSSPPGRCVARIPRPDGPGYQIHHGNHARDGAFDHSSRPTIGDFEDHPA